MISQLELFHRNFELFKNKHNIEEASNITDPNVWLSVDCFLLRYLNHLSRECTILNIIGDYGIPNAVICLMNFYKNDLCIDDLKTDKEILNYLAEQDNDKINNEIVLAILREEIGFKGFRRR
jgi:hypothetical protein